MKARASIGLQTKQKRRVTSSSRRDNDVGWYPLGGTTPRNELAEIVVRRKSAFWRPMQTGRRSKALIVLAALLLAALPFSACGPRVRTDSPLIFEDDDSSAAAPLAIETVEFARSRSGTISRHKLQSELAKGVGNFLASIEVEAVSEGRRFVAWQVLQFDNDWIDLIPGDTVSSVNGHKIETPAQVQGLWDSLRTANVIVVAASRDGLAFELRITIAGTADEPIDLSTKR